MSDLVSRALAAIEETERIARAATPGPWEYEGDDPTDDEVYSVHPDEGEGSPIFGNTVAFTRDRQVPNMVHIAHNDPAAVLRRCAADRKLLELHAQVPAYGGTSTETGCERCLWEYSWGCDIYEGICDTVKIMAEGYGISVEEETTGEQT